MLSEEWRDVVGYEGFYQVSNLGRVKSLDRILHQKNIKLKTYNRIWLGKILNPSYRKDGRRYVTLWQLGVPCKYPVSRLVLLAFVGPCPKNKECCHIDGNASNDNIDNLRWDTRKSNVADAIAHGTATIGEKNGFAKLSNNDIIQIRKLQNNGWTLAKIAKRFKVSQSHISGIINRKFWKHVQ